MSSMFSEAALFNQPVGGWNTGAVTAMNTMFDGAVSFDQPIGTWNVTSVTDMTGMFGDSAGLSIANYDELLMGWASEAVHTGVTFDAGTSEYNGLAAHAHDAVLLTGDGWTITDGGSTTALIPSRITTLPVASAITYGQRLGVSQLSGGVADTAGTFGFVAPAQLLDAGRPRVAVRFTPASSYYAPATVFVTVPVAQADAALALSGLKTIRHGRSLTVSVSRLVVGARLRLVWRTGRHVFERALTASARTVRVALALRVRGTYRVTASASDPNVSFGAASGTVRAI
jgi:hypothetical protein